MRYLSVCSGIEAASVAWRPLGWETVAFSEIEPFPCAVLKHHYPDVPNLGDMTKIDGSKLKGKVDVIIGGTPCQAFSIAGKRLSLEDERGNLTLKFVELCDAIEPSFIVWENVPGVLNTTDNAFGQFLGKLSGSDIELFPPSGTWTNAGYVLGQSRNIAWRVLNAQYFGIPQRRKRVFVVASPRNGQDPRDILFERESLPRHFEQSREKKESLTNKNERSPRTTNFKSHWQGGEIHPTLSISGGHGCPGISNQDVFGQNGSCLIPVTNPYDKKIVLYERATHSNIKESSICPTIIARYGTGGNQTPLIMYENHSMDARVKEVNTCPTIRNNMGTSIPLIMIKNGKYGIEPNQKYTIRRIMPLECERLQGFPDWYTRIPYKGKPNNKCPHTPRYKAIGNSMAVPVIAWLGERIDKVSKISKETEK